MLPTVKKILVTTDFSQNAWLAMKHAFGLVQQTKARLAIMHVLPELPKELTYAGGPSLLFGGYGPGASGVPPMPKDLSDHDEKLKEQINRENRDKALMMAKDHIKSLCLRLRQEVGDIKVKDEDIITRMGSPVQTILDEVNNGGHDMVIMGRRGHGKLRGPRTGGVASGVLIRSSIPILIVSRPK
jgi:nucleotide-binding universal stress UspA family protein